MASLIKQSGRYYLQFFDSNRTPARKRLSLRTSRKRPAQSKRRELEDAYVEGLFDPWVDDPFGYATPDVEVLTLCEARDRFLEAKNREGCTDNTVRTYREVLRLLHQITGSTLLDHVTAPQIDELVHDHLT